MRKQFVILFLTSISYIYAQDIEVKKFEALVKDQTATLSPRKDINGTECGLVKVALKEPGAEFEGNVMGDVQFTGKEYLVYLPDGTKRLGIKHQDYLPTTVVFADYGTKKVASKTTYQLKVKANKKKAKVDKSKKGIALFNIKPSNAMLLIDGQIADGSGGAYTLSLPYGTHFYTVKLRDFSINNQPVNIDKNAKNISMDLTEFFAKLDISCTTTDAEISVNGEQKGIGSWGGLVAPGKYTIVTQKDGCHPQTRQIELFDNDSISVNFSKLKTITGSLLVDYEPAGSDVLLNGKKVGVTPLELKDLPVGHYNMTISNNYCEDGDFSFNIAEDQVHKETGSLKMGEFAKIYYSARKGNERDQMVVVGYLYNGSVLLDMVKSLGYEGDCLFTFWNDTISLNPIEALRLAKVFEKYDILKTSNNEGKSNFDLFKIAESEITISQEEIVQSFLDCKKEVDNFIGVLDGMREEDPTWMPDYDDFDHIPFGTLAWYYFYGIGCQKNVKEADKLVRLACKLDLNKKYVGKHCFPAFVKLIRDMGLDNDLVFDKDASIY